MSPVQSYLTNPAQQWLIHATHPELPDKSRSAVADLPDKFLLEKLGPIHLQRMPRSIFIDDTIGEGSIDVSKDADHLRHLLTMIGTSILIQANSWPVNIEQIFVHSSTTLEMALELIAFRLGFGRWVGRA